ncbi:MAG: hypothetical protein WA962_09295 [Ornithinimicrobium sp.]
MWHNNVKVRHYYANSRSQACFAIFDGVAGWKPVATGAADGVTNVAALLSAAHTHDRPVSAYLVDDKVERVMVQ